MSPDLAAAALVDVLADIACPVTRARETARVGKWLRSTLTRLRWAAVGEARATTSVVVLSKELEVTPGRVYQGLSHGCAAASVPPPASGPAESARTHRAAEAADSNLTVSARTEGMPS